MLPFWKMNKPESYLGSPIKLTEEARYNESTRFFRVASSLGLARRKSTLTKFCRFIRYGVLSAQDAQDLLFNRLPYGKLMRYSLMKYWISNHFIEESWFYFNSFMVWPVNPTEVENTIVFP